MLLAFMSVIIWVLTEYLSDIGCCKFFILTVIFQDHPHLCLGSDSLYNVHFKQWWGSFLGHVSSWSLPFWQMRNCKKNLTISIVQLYCKFLFPTRYNFLWDKTVSNQNKISYIEKNLYSVSYHWLSVISICQLF